jgi:hypothetical protein
LNFSHSLELGVLNQQRAYTKRSEDGVGSTDLRQMSEYPIPHEGQYHSCILRRWRPAFLHPKGEIQICNRADEQNVLDCSLPPIKVITEPVHLRKPANPWPMRKTHLTQS